MGKIGGQPGLSELPLRAKMLDKPLPFSSMSAERRTSAGRLGFQSRHITARWRGGATGRALDFAISRSRVQILLEATLRNNLRQVVHTYVPLSPSSITWYRPKGGDALRLGR